MAKVNKGNTGAQPGPNQELEKPIWKYSGIAFGAVLAFVTGSLVENAVNIPFIRYYPLTLYLLIVGLYMYRYRDKGKKVTTSTKNAASLSKTTASGKSIPVSAKSTLVSAKNSPATPVSSPTKAARSGPKPKSKKR